MNQSEDGPFSMFSLTRLHLSRPKTLPLQSQLTRKVLISAHSFPFTADWLKLAKSSITIFLYGAQHFWTEFRICLTEPSDFNKNILICVLKMNKGLTGVERHEASEPGSPLKD